MYRVHFLPTSGHSTAGPPQVGHVELIGTPAAEPDWTPEHGLEYHGAPAAVFWQLQGALDLHSALVASVRVPPPAGS